MNYAKIKKPKNDLTDKTFGKLTILEYMGCDGKNSLWKAKCDCGNYTIAIQSMLLRGKKKSCGCLPQCGKKKGVCGFGINDMPVGYKNISTLTKAVYDLWVSIITRCYKFTNKTKSYADRCVCERWKYLSNFANDIKRLNGYIEWEKQHISNNKIPIKERYVIDKDSINREVKMYSPQTCQFIQWIDNEKEMLLRCKKENTGIFSKDNKYHPRKSDIGIKLFKDGENNLEFKTLRSAADFLGVKYHTLYMRLRKKQLLCNGYRIELLKRGIV